MATRLMLHKAGSQFIRRNFLPPTRVHTRQQRLHSILGELLADNLERRGAFPEAVARAQKQFDEGAESVLIEIP